MPDFMERMIRQRRETLADEMASLQAEIKHWNRTHPNEEPIVLSANLGPDVTAMSKALASAITYLDATEVAPGRFAWRGPEFESYVVADRTALLSSDYSGWVAAVNDSDPVICLPDWWSPTHREATRCSICRSVAPDSWNEGPCDKHAPRAWERITANLESGEEIPV